MKPITSNQYPRPAKRPRNPVTNRDKIKQVFGLKIPHWEDQLRSCIADLVNSGEQGLRANRL